MHGRWFLVDEADDYTFIILTLPCNFISRLPAILLLYEPRYNWLCLDADQKLSVQTFKGPCHLQFFRFLREVQT